MVKFAMPDNLSDETQKFIKDVVKELNARKAIQNIDLGAIRMLATSYEMYLQATEILLEEGPVIQIKYEKAANPAQWKIQCKMPPKTKRFYPLVPK